jgi:hypothetical protein
VAVTPPAEPTPSTPAEQAATLFDGQGTPPVGKDIPAETPPAERDPALPPEGETPEAKAAREAAETPEQKTARETAEAKVAKEGEKDERYGAPEGEADYADFALPEGVTLDAEGATDLKSLAKELNLSQASAQKLVDKLIAKQARDAAAGEANVNSIREGWQTATRADKEFGGDKLNASLATAQKALKQFGSPELNELVVGAGLGDHPEFIRLLVKVGNAVSEAPIVNGGPSVTNDAAGVMYPNHPRQK